MPEKKQQGQKEKTPKQKMLIKWLNDSVAMEREVTRLLEDHVKEAKDYPILQSKLKEHLEITRQHEKRMKEWVKKVGGEVSKVEVGMAEVKGRIIGFQGALTKDKVLNNAMSAYATEQLEMGAYTAVIAGAYELNEQELAKEGEAIMAEEQEMARWLGERLGELAVEVMKKETSK